MKSIAIYLVLCSLVMGCAAPQKIRDVSSEYLSFMEQSEQYFRTERDHYRKLLEQVERSTQTSLAGIENEIILAKRWELLARLIEQRSKNKELVNPASLYGLLASVGMLEVTGVVIPEPLTPGKMSADYNHLYTEILDLLSRIDANQKMIHAYLTNPLSTVSLEDVKDSLDRIERINKEMRDSIKAIKEARAKKG